MNMTDTTKARLIQELFAQEKKNPTRKILFPGDALPALLRYRNRKQEHFIVVTLNGANEVIRLHVITKGLVNRTLVHAREVFRTALYDNAASIIIAHNHPSGSVDPSNEDTEVTQRMKGAGDIIGIAVLDHIVFSKRGYYSYRENGRM